MPKAERRAFNVELRVDGTNDKPKIVGHAAVFNQLSEELWWGVRERIEPGAFKETLEKSDVRALWNHDANYVLGRNTAGTLTLSEDETGLYVEINPPDTQWARDLLVSMRRGDVNQMSFAFQVDSEKWEVVDKQRVRVITKVDPLYDVSVVTYPAYPQTDANVRKMLDDIGIEWDKINEILARKKLGLELLDDDYKLIMRSIDLLNTLLPEVQERESKESECSQEASLEILRRRLELIEKSI